MNSYSKKLAIAAICFLPISLFAQSSGTLTNNTSGCDLANSHSYCDFPFTDMHDGAVVFNRTPVEVSTVDMHCMFPYASEDSNHKCTNVTSKVFSHLTDWFCTDPNHKVSGDLNYKCNFHIQVGYNLLDTVKRPQVVATQLADMTARGFDGVIVDWYGPVQRNPTDPISLVTAEIASQLASTSNCSSPQHCRLSFALQEDDGSFGNCWTSWSDTYSSLPDCILQKMTADLSSSAALSFFNNPAYLKIDSATHQISSTGRPKVFFFVDESTGTNNDHSLGCSPSVPCEFSDGSTCPSQTTCWSLIWSKLSSNLMSQNPAFEFRNAQFSHTASSGQYAWVDTFNPFTGCIQTDPSESISTDTYGYCYLQNFYNGAVIQSSWYNGGTAFKGFDGAISTWAASKKKVAARCGVTWLESWKQVSQNNNFTAQNQLPYLQIATWNDYEEGTEMETGIDSCWSVTIPNGPLALNAGTQGTIQWTLVPGSSDAILDTIDKIQVLSQPANGGPYSVIAELPSNSTNYTVSCSGGTPGPSTYVKLLGKPGIQNIISPVAATCSGDTRVNCTGTSCSF